MLNVNASGHIQNNKVDTSPQGMEKFLVSDEKKVTNSNMQVFPKVMPGIVLCLCALAFAGCAGLSQEAAPFEPLQQDSSRLLVEISNPGFELWDVDGLCPVGWQCSQHAGEPSFIFLPEKDDRVEGTTSMRIERVGSQPWAAVRQSLMPASIQGKYIRLSAKVKLAGVTGLGAGIMLATSGSIKTPTPSYQTYAVGTTDWQTIKVEGEIPPTVSRVTLGVMLEGGGMLLVDDVLLEVLLPE